MDSLNSLSILAAITNIVLGLLVFLKNPKRAVNITFLIFSFASAIWALANFYFFVFDKNLLAFKLVYATGGVIAPLLVPWFLFLLENKNKIFGIVLFYLLALVLFVVPFIDGTIISSLEKGGAAGYSFGTGPLFNAFSVAVFVALLYLFYLVIKARLGSRGVKRTQLTIILLGLSFYAAVAILIGLILPLFNITPAVPFDAQSSMILVGFSAYAIIRHHFLDIRLVVARSLAYILLISSLASFYALSVLGLEMLFFPGQMQGFNFAEGAMRTVIAVIMVFLFQPLKTWITKATDKIFFRNQYDQDELLSELSNTMGSTIVLIELLYKVGDIITKNLKASRVLFALIKDDTRMYTVQATGYKKTPDVDPRDVLKMTHDGVIHYDDLEEGSRMKHLLSEYEANLAIPLKTEGEIIGVMLLGEKSSGDMYSQQDLSVLEILGPELAIAVENAKAYEEISRFNTTLRQEVKRATYRLKQKNEQLMELDHAKDEFISMASHQLRTPLTAIKGYLSMLLEGDAGDIKVSQYDFINEAYSGANRMVGLINDLLNVSRMDTGRFFLEPKEVDIEKVVEEEMKQLTNSAKAKGLYLKVEKKGKVPHIYADETKIRQVVMNFMDNAIYYTNTGGVTVVLRHDKDDFIYEVHDTGIGVPKAQRDHLFEKFFRADNARTARPDGTGLGIYLAKRVVEDHGGEIIFDSTEGKGSIFGFRFPLKKRSMPKLASAPAPKTTETIAATPPTASEVVSAKE